MNAMKTQVRGVTSDKPLCRRSEEEITDLLNEMEKKHSNTELFQLQQLTGRDVPRSDRKRREYLALCKYLGRKRGRRS
jgi:hypothetical protein